MEFPYQLDFVNVGPQKTASTWLHAVLEEHPLICLPKGVKETFYFDRRFSQVTADWYWSHFKDWNPSKLAGEIAPSYFDDEQARRQLQASSPECKVIINIRNPVERAFSLFRHHLSKGRVPPEFWSATRKMPRILTSGAFHHYIPAWQKDFGKERIFLLQQEDVSHSPEAVIDQLCRFLKVGPMAASGDLHERKYAMRSPRYPWLGGAAFRTADFLRRHKLYTIVELAKRAGAEWVFTGGEDKLPQLTDALYREIHEKLSPEIDYLEQRLQRDLSHWRVPKSERSMAAPSNQTSTFSALTGPFAVPANKYQRQEYPQR